MTILEVRDLTKSFGGVGVADCVSFSLAAGDRVALIGPNGAGKSSLLNLLTGLVAPDRGSIMFAGSSLERVSQPDRVRRGLARSFQQARLFADQTVRKHLALAVLARQRRAGQMIGDWRQMAAVVREVDVLLAQMGLVDQAEVAAEQIAYGQQRLLDLAMTLALKPKVLLLDEPTAGVSGDAVRLIEDVLSNLPSELAVLMVEHDIDLVFRFARRILVMAEGRLIFDGLPADAAVHAGVRAAYLGAHGDGRFA